MLMYIAFCPSVWPVVFVLGSPGITVGVLRTTSQDHGVIDPLKRYIIKMSFPVTAYEPFLKDGTELLMVVQIEGREGQRKDERHSLRFWPDAWGSMEEAGKEGGPGQIAQSWEYQGQCWNWSSALHWEKGIAVIDLSENFNM